MVQKDALAHASIIRAARARQRKQAQAEQSDAKRIIEAMRRGEALAKDVKA